MSFDSYNTDDSNDDEEDGEFEFGLPENDHDDDDEPPAGAAVMVVEEDNSPETPMAPTAEPKHVVNPMNTPVV